MKDITLMPNDYIVTHTKTDTICEHFSNDDVVYVVEERIVPLVRCKECAKWLGSSGICMWDKSTSLFTKADDYCSYGVRETNTTAEEKPTPIRDYMVHGEREGE